MLGNLNKQDMTIAANIFIAMTKGAVTVVTMNKKNLRVLASGFYYNQKDFMSLFKTLLVFKLEKRRYLVGVWLVLVFPSSNLIPPIVVGGSLCYYLGAKQTQRPSLLDLFYPAACSFGILLSALCLAYVSLRTSYRLGQIMLVSFV